MENIKAVVRKNLGLHLYLTAQEFDKILAAIDRHAASGLADHQPVSNYTPSREESRERLDGLSASLIGYCQAVDDMLQLSHGTTHRRFHQAREQKLHQPLQGVDIVDHDASHALRQSDLVGAEAAKRFLDAILA